MNTKIDILERQPIVTQIIELIRTIAGNGKSCTFSIDGHWGCGKTYLLSMLEEQLSLYQAPNAAGDRYIIFHYNCWQYDFYEEPAIAIVSAIKSEINRYNRILPELPETVQKGLKITGNIGKRLLESYLESKIGCNPIELLNEIADTEDSKSRDLSSDYDKYFEFKEALDATREELAKLATGKPIILVIDELDRCMPQYAIKVLERIHHLFDENSNIIVILAIDHCQLERTVQQIFGDSSSSDDDAQKIMAQDYLRKFINFTVSLDYGKLSNKFLERYKPYVDLFDVTTEEDKKFIEELVVSLFTGIDVRAQERIMEKTETLHSLCFSGEKHPGILCFELMHEVLAFKKAVGNSFDWIFEMNHINSFNMRNQLGDNLYNYINQLIKDIISTATHYIIGWDKRDQFVLDSCAGSMMLWLFAVQRPIKSKQETTSFIFSDDADYDYLKEKVKKFCDISKLIS